MEGFQFCSKMPFLGVMEQRGSQELHFQQGWVTKGLVDETGVDSSQFGPDMFHKIGFRLSVPRLHACYAPAIINVFTPCTVTGSTRQC